MGAYEYNPCSMDFDGDGVGFCEDCDDKDAGIFPGNPEVCDGKDNDCVNVKIFHYRQGRFI